jgi:hypothetical protein
MRRAALASILKSGGSAATPGESRKKHWIHKIHTAGMISFL